jgi:hypothetical protein
MPCHVAWLWMAGPGGGDSLRLRSGKGIRDLNLESWPSVAARHALERRRAVVIGGRSSAWNGGELPPGAGLVFWYLPVEAVSHTPDDVLDFLRGYDVRRLEVYTRYQVKMAVYDRLWAVVLVHETREEADRITHLLHEGIGRFRGDAIGFAAGERPE